MTVTDMASFGIEQTKISRAQNICGGVFVFLYILNFAFRLLQYNDVIPYGTIWINISLGILGIIGFTLLSKLSSNMAADFFAVCQIGMEVFFSAALPVLSVYFSADSDFYEPVFWLCIGFSMFSIYFWSVLFNNCKFSVGDKMWVLLLPLINIYNIAHYFNCISRINDSDAVFRGAFYDNNAMMVLRLCLIPLVSLGYWKLCHSEAFSGPQENFTTPKMTPFNVYFISYVALVAVAYYAF